MNVKQQAARQIMEQFVNEQDGNPADIRQVGNSYRWTAPDGREAGLGWES